MSKEFDDSRGSADIAKLEMVIERQSLLLTNLAAEAKRSHSATTALIALAQALIESHPSPKLLARSFLDQIDAVGSLTTSTVQVEMYRDDLQKLNRFILDVVQRKSGPGDQSPD